VCGLCRLPSDPDNLNPTISGTKQGSRKDDLLPKDDLPRKDNLRALSGRVDFVGPSGLTGWNDHLAAIGALDSIIEGVHRNDSGTAPREPGEDTNRVTRETGGGRVSPHVL